MWSHFMHEIAKKSPTTPAVAGVYIGLDSVATGGIEISASSTQYIDFTIIKSDYRVGMSYVNGDSGFNWYVGANAAAMPNMTNNVNWSICSRCRNIK